MNAQQVIRVERVRRLKGVETCEVESYRSSRDRTRARALDFLKWICAQGGIENPVHHVRDVTFDEDHCRVRKGGSAQVLGALRNVAIHLISGVKALSRRWATHRFPVHPEQAIHLIKSEQCET